MKNTIVKKLSMLAVAGMITITAFAQKPSKRLYNGITKGNLEMVKLAVADGADVNKKIDMKEPLMWALETSHHVDIIKFLIEKGADVNDGGVTGSILHRYAGVVKTPEEKVKWMMEFYKKYKVDTVIDPSVHSSIKDVVTLLLESGANANKDNGTILGTPLQSAIVYGIGSEDARAQFVAAMLAYKKANVDPNDRFTTDKSVGVNPGPFKMVDKEKHPTPLIYATDKGYAKIAKALIEGGANVNATMNTYGTEFSALATYKTKSAVTALYIAEQKGNKEIIDILKAAGAQ